MPTAILQGKSPYEMFHNIKPQLDHLRSFGCLCYATKHVKDDKFSPRADVCAMIGYFITQKGYILYNLSSKKFLVNRDVVFKEHLFPFSHLTPKNFPMFVATSFSHYDDVLVHNMPNTNDAHNMPSTDDAQDMMHNSSLPDVPVTKVTARFIMIVMQFIMVRMMTLISPQGSLISRMMQG